MTTLAWLVALYPLVALATDSGDLRIEKRDRAYVIRMSFEVPANTYQVRSVITDYRDPARLSSVVRKREIISREGGVVRVATEMRGCALFFCKTMKLVQDVVESEDSVRADVVPNGSDFRSGYLLWSIVGEESGRSRVVFEAVMEPDFFVPPLIGGFLIRSTLEKQVKEIARNLASEAVQEPSAPYRRGRPGGRRNVRRRSPSSSRSGRTRRSSRGPGTGCSRFRRWRRRSFVPAC